MILYRRIEVLYMFYMCIILTLSDRKKFRKSLGKNNLFCYFKLFQAFKIAETITIFRIYLVNFIDDFKCRKFFTKLHKNNFHFNDAPCTRFTRVIGEIFRINLELDRPNFYSRFITRNYLKTSLFICRKQAIYYISSRQY